MDFWIHDRFLDTRKDFWISTIEIIRDVPCRAVPRSGGSVPCQIFPCRALMIRAVPNISVPCPDDPCPDLVNPCRAAQEGFQKYEGPFFVRKKSACGNVPTSQGLPEIWGPFFWKKKRLRQRTHKLRASRNMWPFSVGKKANAATYPQVKGFQKFGPLGIQAEKHGFRTAWLITGQKFP